MMKVEWHAASCIGAALITFPYAAGADLQNPSAGGQYGTEKVVQVPE
jgi:hypothetical protein